MIINANMAINALIRLVSGKEDYCYPIPQVYDSEVGETISMCVYAYESRPSCGVGRALSNLGMSTFQLEIMDAHVGNTAIASVDLPAGWYLTTVARKIFAGFQNMQDREGTTWGEALDRAKAIAVNPNHYDMYGALF